MKTLINGREKKWTLEIEEAWVTTGEENRPEGEVIYANYFTPRPYRNEYDRGSTERGFTYILKSPTRGLQVMQVLL